MTFAAGVTDVSVNVPILDDMNITRSSEIFSAQLKSIVSDVILGDSIANISILDNDGEEYIVTRHHSITHSIQPDTIVSLTTKPEYK